MTLLITLHLRLLRGLVFCNRAFFCYDSSRRFKHSGQWIVYLNLLFSKCFVCLHRNTNNTKEFQINIYRSSIQIHNPTVVCVVRALFQRGNWLFQSAEASTTKSTMLPDLVIGNFINVRPMITIDRWINWCFLASSPPKFPSR